MKIPISWLKEYISLPPNTKELTDKLTSVGHMLDKKAVVDGETVIDLELRGNRADCYSVIGIAREVSAIFGGKLKKPPTIDLKKGNIGVKLDVKTPLVKRVGMIEIRNVVIKPSPEWLSKRLTQYGMDSVNNIVDLTNYVMIETGEPMHAFDLDKVGRNLEIRLAINGEKLTTFMGGQLTLSDDDLVWAKSSQILSVAGAVGEKYNSISDSTKNVLLEAANYDRANIRRTVYRHRLLTDAGIRHEKDLDPEMVEQAIGRFLYLLEKNKWGEFKNVFYDYYPKKVLPRKIYLSLAELESLGGVKIGKSEISKILQKLYFKIVGANKDSLEVEPPTFRTDVSCQEDVIEEVLRIYGYDKIPQNVLSLPIPKNITPDYIDQENTLRQAAISTGFNEVISNSFVSEKLSKFNRHPETLGNEVVTIINPPSPDVRNMRLTLLPNLYEHVMRAINEREEETQLFEIGKTYMKIKNTYHERRNIGFVFHANEKDSFIKFKSIISGFFEKADLPEIEYVGDAINLPLTKTYMLMLGKERVGFGGSLDGNIYYLELELDPLLTKRSKYQIRLWPKYPPQIEDITIGLPEKTKVGEVINTIKFASPRITKVELKDVFKNNYTFNIEYQDPGKTLTDSEVENIRKRFLSTIKSKYGGNIKD